MLESFYGKKVVIFVPHEDDEINIAGSLIYQLRTIAQCRIVFFTNGDYFVSSSRRIKESKKALKTLGIKGSQIYYMGYPDVSDNVSKCTYLIDSHNASKYTRYNCIQDLKSIILSERPDYIIANEMDKHINHKELSLLIDESINEIKSNKKYKDYNPLIFKTFAYSLAYYAIDDYSECNLKSTRNNEVDEFNAVFDWENRLRLPVPLRTRTCRITQNIIFKALWKYHTQTAYKNATRIANSDKVYWVRRTDGLQYDANYEASSGDTSYLHDGKLSCVDEKLEIDFEKLWKPNINDVKRSIRISWDEGRLVKKIVFYENPQNDNNITELSIVMENGYKKVISDIRHDGKKNYVLLDNEEIVRWIDIIINQSEGENAGITELEIYDGSVGEFWFGKICVGEDYVYDYYFDEGEIIKFNIVAFDNFGDRYELDKECLKYTLIKSNKEVTFDGEIQMESYNGEAVVRVYYNDVIIDEVRLLSKKYVYAKGNIDAMVYKLYNSMDWLINEYYRIPVLLKRMLRL